VNAYACDQCDWNYIWTMGDRVQAVKQHQLAHLLEGRDKSKGNAIEVPVHELADYIRERLETARWV